MKPIVGSIVALVTPMHEDGFLDAPARFVQRIVAVREDRPDGPPARRLLAPGRAADDG